MQRANRLDVECGGLLEHCLHLVAVLAHDVEVVAAGFAGPVVRVGIVHAELAERIGGEQHLFGLLVAEQDFGPMHHRRTDKLERVLAERERVAFLDGERLLRLRQRRELREHRERLGRRDDCRIGVGLHEGQDAAGVVGLDVVDHQVVGRLAVELLLEVFHPVVHLAGIHGVEHRDLLVHDDVGIVGHAVREVVLPFENVQVAVVYANVLDAVAKIFHVKSSFWKKIIFRLSKKGNGIENAWLYDSTFLQKQKRGDG